MTTERSSEKSKTKEENKKKKKRRRPGLCGKKPLSDIALKFVDEYVARPIGSEAALAAGYSAKTADKRAFQLLVDTRVQAEIARKRKVLCVKYEISQDKVLKEYAKIAFSNMADYAEWNAGAVVFKDSLSLKRRQTAAVSEISQSVTAKGETTIKLKLHDKKGALDSISRHLGLFIDKKEISGPGGKPIEVSGPEVDLSILSDEELDQYEKLTKKLTEAKLDKREGK